jgi:hypothetical protein
MPEIVSLAPWQRTQQRRAPGWGKIRHADHSRGHFIILKQKIIEFIMTVVRNLLDNDGVCALTATHHASAQDA